MAPLLPLGIKNIINQTLLHCVAEGIIPKAQQEKDKEFFGDSYHDCDYVFRWSDGRPFSPDYVTGKFQSLLKAHGMPKIRFHELRHSAASNLLSLGFSLKDGLCLQGRDHGL